MAAAHQSERRFGRTEHAHAMRRVLVERGGARQFARITGGVVFVGTGDDDRGEPAERRITALLARGDLRGIERLAILRDQRAREERLSAVRPARLDRCLRS